MLLWKIGKKAKSVLYIKNKHNFNFRCCSEYAWCGSTPSHCCPTCPQYNHHSITYTFYTEVEFAEFHFLDPGGHAANCSLRLQSPDMLGFLNSFSYTSHENSVKLDGFVCFGENRQTGTNKEINELGL